MRHVYRSGRLVWSLSVGEQLPQRDTWCMTTSKKEIKFNWKTNSVRRYGIRGMHIGPTDLSVVIATSVCRMKFIEGHIVNSQNQRKQN